MAEIDDYHIERYFSGNFVDNQELELYKEGDAKKLYKYGVENDKPWTIFVKEGANMQDIERAIRSFEMM